MTALPLFDVLALPSVGGSEDSGQLARFAEQLIAASLADLRRLKDAESQFVPAPNPDFDRELQIRRTLWSIYSAWADEAERVLRVVSGTAGVKSADLDELDVAIGKVRARLTVTPEQTAKAIHNARQGRVHPAQELRDELRARLRA